MSSRSSPAPALPPGLLHPPLVGLRCGPCRTSRDQPPALPLLRPQREETPRPVPLQFLLPLFVSSSAFSVARNHLTSGCEPTPSHERRWSPRRSLPAPA